jgi:hypothetical protein
MCFRVASSLSHKKTRVGKSHWEWQIPAPQRSSGAPSTFDHGIAILLSAIPRWLQVEALHVD